MPADDTYDFVHEKNKEAPIYGCWNRQTFKSGYYAPDRVYKPDGTFHLIQTFIPFRNSEDCRYDQPTDKKCAGCRWQKAG